MLYYSMQVLWPRQSGLLFASVEQPILRGVYANLTIWGTWRKFHIVFDCIVDFELTSLSISTYGLAHLCKAWS
jgi:hypothetical protein